MNHTLTNAIMMACILLFIHSTTWRGMILQKLDQITVPRRTKKVNKRLIPHIQWTEWNNEKRGYDAFMTYREVVDEITEGLPAWVTKPLWECIICMAPWWTTAIGLPIFYGGYFFNRETAAFILTTAGIAVIIDTYVIGKREERHG